MKNIIAFFTVILAVQGAFAQTGTHLKLSDQYPAAGEKITLTYNPAGTVVDGKKNISAVVYYLDNKDFPAADIDMKPDGKLLSGEISIPATAKAFFIKISSDKAIDNNDDKGYVYLVYKDKQPVEGACASEAYCLTAGPGANYAKIKINTKKGIVLYKQEFALYPDSKKAFGSFYYYLIAQNPDYKVAVNQAIDSLEKGTDEKELILATNLLKITKNIKGADSLNTIIKSRFPNGELAKNEFGNIIIRTNILFKKDSLYHVFIKMYPDTGKNEHSIQNYIRYQLASAFAKAGDMVNAQKYQAVLTSKTYLNNYLNGLAWDWVVAGLHLDEAEKLSKQSVDLATEMMKAPGSSAFTSPKQEKENYQSEYNADADTYAYILLKVNKAAEALKYMQDVYDRTSDEENSIEHYVMILAANGQYKKALEITGKSIKAGQNSGVLKDELKKDYIKVNGNDNGYNKYLTSLEDQSKIGARAELAKTMIKQPAPVFALKDLDGNLVSLKELKGKVVIVDFWATWCGPCKASFPGMQIAVNKYKDDPNVKFLFVDTWENGDNYIDGTKKFITDNKYTFHVLMDEKGDDGRQSKIVSAFGVTGIPTKFIIDKNGNIRFTYIGYSGTPEKLVDEVTAMVEMASNPDGEVSTEKASVNK